MEEEKYNKILRKMLERAVCEVAATGFPGGVPTPPAARDSQEREMIVQLGAVE